MNIAVFLHALLSIIDVLKGKKATCAYSYQHFGTQEELALSSISAFYF